MEVAAILLTCTFVLLTITNIVRVKYVVRSKWSLPVIVLLTPVAVFASILLLPLLSVFWVYRELIRLYLIMKWRSKFVGLIKGADVIYTCGPHEKSVMTILFMLECSTARKPEDVYQDFKGAVFKALFSDPLKLPEFRSVVKRCGGYSYLCNGNVTVDECVKKMKVVKCERKELNEDELRVLLQNCVAEEFPRNNTLFMDSFVGTQPVEWSGYTKTNVSYYPALVRIHHAICDGFAVTQMFAAMSDKPKNADESRKTLYNENLKQGSRMKSVAYYFLLFWTTIIFNSSEVLLKFLLDKPKPNILRGGRLTGIEMLSMKTDAGAYYKRIKAIKNSLDEVGFADVVLTAFSASLKDHFRKQSSHHPESISIVVPFLPKATTIPLLPIGELMPHDISLQNSFAMLTFDLPLFIDDASLSFRLRAVQRERERAYNSIGNKILYFTSHFLMQVLPLPILTMVHDKLHWSAVLSILPGPLKASIANGSAEIENIVFWPPLLTGIGVSVSILSYANKMQLGLKFDKALMGNEEDALDILDGVFKYIDLFTEEINLYKIN
uniref:O-acyltransferase WSD1 C-terminal domain-containing protein n=1 Tax=Photinus pyralis TaxID=7054 RepID=A0A1Y1N136_PHOPY